jgi:hypothetical protein
LIAKISDPRGKRIGGLIYYLFGPGRREEHTDPHLVAGWRHPAELEPSLRPDGRRDFGRLTGLLQQPHAVLGSRGFERPVWHCAVRAAPGDRLLSDDEWAQIAGDLMHRTALSPRGQDDDAVRWVAVRHSADHIHIVALLARQDGGKPRLANERYRVREACRAAEERYGLRRTAPGDRTAARRPSRAESEKARRTGGSEAPRITLRRAVSTAAAGASSEQEFFGRLAAAGILVRTRLSARASGEVTGYSVALPGDTARGGDPVWFGGGKLASDLTLPRLRRRWEAARVTSAVQFTPQERKDIWEHAARTAASAAAQIRGDTAASPAAAADAAWAAADVLNVAAAALGSRVLRQAADSYDRAARAPYGKIPRPTPVGNSLRQTARIMAAAAAAGGDETTRAVVALIHQLVTLAEAAADLRRARGHVAQAAAARRAAGQLRVAAPEQRVPSGDPRGGRSRSAAGRIRLEFPEPLRLDLDLPAGPGPARPGGTGSRSPRRPRGPTR